jgi:nitrogen regulatory protein PII
MFIFCQSGTLFCICSNEEYKESPQAYGDTVHTKIFRFWPSFKQFDLDPSGNKNVFLNTRLRQLKLGLIFGHGLLKPILKIDESFHSVEHELQTAGLADQIISVEVWGCGSSKAASYQRDMKNWESKQIEKMKTSKFNPDFNADKNILDMAGIKTEHSERGDM